MKKTKNAAISLALVLFMSFGVIPLKSFALTLNNTENKYEEFHEQIDFKDLSVYVVNGKNLAVKVNSSISVFRQAKAKIQQEKYNALIAQHPNALALLRDTINSCSNIYVLSYTEAPVMYVGDHYERIPKKPKRVSSLFTFEASADEVAISDESTCYRLTLMTMISRSGINSPYTYSAVTYGIWDNSVSVFGGEKKPAAGEDYILQACPTITSSSEFFSTYNYATSGSTEGQEGQNFFSRDGGDSWIEYGVIDDPFGAAQLTSFLCRQSFISDSTSTTKKINSYYIHTWKAMTLSVTVSGSAGASGGIPSAGVELSFTPGEEDKQWQLYNFVSYNW